MGKLIINADDYGYSSSINKAIVESFESRQINSTSIMANMPGFEEAIYMAHEKKITDKIGVHLVLTEGISLTEEIRSMKFLFNKQDFTPDVRNKKLFFLNMQEQTIILKEYSAQIEKVRSNGIKITHLDTHHQIHDMWAISRLLFTLLKTYDIPTMRILNNLEKSKNIFKDSYRHLMNQYMKAQKINYTDYLGNRIDFLEKLNFDPAFSKNNSVEIMVHPSYNIDGLLIDRIGKKEFDFRFPPEITNFMSF